MATDEGAPASQPIRRDLRLTYCSSLAIALLSAAAAILGIVFRDLLYQSDEVLLFVLPTDIISLAIVLPILLVSMWLARRGSLAGILVWPGMLLYVVYINLVFLLGVPFGATFPLYVVLVALGAYTLIALVAAIDARQVRQRLLATAPASTAGVILAVLSILFIAIQVPEIITAIVERRVMAGLELAPFVGDVIVLLPAWLIGGILLWQRKPLGYVAGPALLLLGTMLCAGLGFVLLFSALYSVSAIDWAGVVMMVAMGAVCGVPCVLFLRGATRGLSPAQSWAVTRGSIAHEMMIAFGSVSG